MAEKLPVRVRMAPSPTGPVHIGSIRTALFNYLFAKRNNGTFVVRIEDTDTERSKPEFEVDILEGFRWLGLLWDEGPEVGGPYEPYRQSERIGSYTKYLKQLFDSGDLYKCFCTEEDLEREHNELLAAKLPPIYSRKCLKLSSEDVRAKESAGENYTLRFKTPDETIVVDDLIRGHL